MKILLVLVTMVASSFACSDVLVSINNATEFDDGSELDVSLIERYGICVMSSVADDCDDVGANIIFVDLAATMILSTDYLASVYLFSITSLSTRTFLLDGRQSVWSAPYTTFFLHPNPPTLSY